MTRYTRIVFGVNALCQTVFGVICLLAPAFAIGLAGGIESEQEIALAQIAFRLMGVYVIPAGVMSALIAGNPDTYPVLRPLMGLTAVLSMVCGGIVLASHHLHPGQIAWSILGAVIQVMLIVAVIFYNPKSRGQSYTTTTRRRTAA